MLNMMKILKKALIAISKLKSATFFISNLFHNFFKNNFDWWIGLLFGSGDLNKICNKKNLLTFLTSIASMVVIYLIML